MERKPHLTEAQRAQIVVLQQQGYSERLVDIRVGCSKKAVSNALDKFKKFGSQSDRPTSGNPRKTSKRDDNMIKKLQ